MKFIREWFSIISTQNIRDLFLIDMDNVAHSLSLLKSSPVAVLKELNRSVFLFGFCGPDFNQSPSKNPDTIKWIQQERALKLITVNPASPSNDLEQLMQAFYSDGYYRKYKNAADFLLSCFCGAAHRLLDLEIRFWLVSRDEDLEFPVKALKYRGRRAFRINDSALVDKLEFVSSSSDELFGAKVRMNDAEDRLLINRTLLANTDRSASTYSQDLPTQIILPSEYSESEIRLKISETTKGVFFDRPEAEEQMGNLIAEAIARSAKKIEWIELRGRRLGPRGSFPIARALKCFAPSLTLLDIRGTRITDPGIVALMEALENIKTIKVLDIGATMFADAGLFGLLRSLEHFFIWRKS